MGYYGPNNMAKVKILEPNNGKHMTVAGDINTGSVLYCCMGDHNHGMNGDMLCQL